MDLDTLACRLMERLNVHPFNIVTRICGNDEHPGCDEVPEWQIFTHRETTLDQTRIEACLDKLIGPSASLFHVGVGNSSLARKFAGRVAAIHGITLHEEEKLLADSFNIPNYFVRVVNKFSKEMAFDNIDKFDFVIDNNPSSFSCCLFHFCRMMVSYHHLLRVGGELLTDELGLKCSTTYVDPAWSLSWDDWTLLGKALTMPSQQLTSTVYSLSRGFAARI